MHAIETHVPTAHASKYLQQLCKHWAHRMAVEFTPTDARVPFNERTTCVMHAGESGIDLRVEAEDEASAARYGGVVIEHLRRFAHREALADPAWRAA